MHHYLLFRLQGNVRAGSLERASDRDPQPIPASNLLSLARRLLGFTVTLPWCDAH
jgi:hypothetical protein